MKGLASEAQLSYCMQAAIYTLYVDAIPFLWIVYPSFFAMMRTLAGEYRQKEQGLSWSPTSCLDIHHLPVYLILSCNPLLVV